MALADNRTKIQALIDGINALTEAGSGAGDGAQVQADWAVNDPSSPSYIQNRTHWVEVEEANFDFDGNTDGRETVDVSGMVAVKISDFVVTYDDLLGKKMVLGPDDLVAESGSLDAEVELTPELIQTQVLDENNFMVIVMMGANFPVPAIVALSNDEVAAQMGFPYAGTYYVIYRGVHIQKIEGLTGYFSENVHTLDEKFIPESVKKRIGSPGSGINAEVFNGLTNEASGDLSHAEGFATKASGTMAHAEGESTEASGDSSHAEGTDTTASGSIAHAEGYETIASGDFASHAEGYASQAIGEYSHAENRGAKAQGAASHAEGYWTIAAKACQHVQGAFNIEDDATIKSNVWGIDTQGKYLHIVGNGTSKEKRSNAHTLDWDGVAWYQGRPQFGGSGQGSSAQTVMGNGDNEIVLKSPNGTLWGITVTNDGVLTVTAK